MPCVYGRPKFYHEEVNVHKASKNFMEKENMVNGPMRHEIKFDVGIADCKDVYKARNISSREMKEKLRERKEMSKLERHLAAIPSVESTTAMGRGRVQRLQALEQKQRARLLTKAEPMVTQRDFENLKLRAKVVTLDERLDALARNEEESKRMEREFEKARLSFKAIDDKRRRDLQRKTQTEDVGADSKHKVLERAFLAKHEQEEEVKKVNRIILNAKCHAVRDAQLHEKTELAREEQNEEQRLADIVNKSAAKKMNIEDDAERKKRETKAAYAFEIRKQLAERENMRFMEAERIEQEAQLLRQSNEAIKRDEERQRQLATERRVKFVEDLNNVLKMSNVFKKMLLEQEREADMRLAAYHKERAQRERAIAAEKQLTKEALERNQQRIFKLAQKILKSNNQREHLSYLREQERLEREYRQKEREAVMRKKKMENELAESRERQLKEIKHRQALQLAREEKDFNMLITLLKQDEEKLRKQDEERECRRRGYRKEIIKQMGDKEKERRRLKELEEEQVAAWREREKERDANIRTVINAKLQAMRDACLPEKYIHEVERHMQKIKKPL